MRAFALLSGSLFVLSSQIGLAAVTITPSNQTIKENATLQLKASVPSTWTTSCGGVSSTGLFHAGLYPATCTVTAKATSDGTTGTTTVIVVSPLTMTPVSASTPQGKTQQFNTSAPVTWVVGCGAITADGLYTASGTVGSFCTVHGTATTSPKYNVYGYVHTFPPVVFNISPASATVSEGASKQFTANAGAAWKASCGTISSSGLYVAPLAAAACTVTATPTAGGTSATASVTVTTPITITPSAASTPQNSTQQFIANIAVQWTASCGSISSSGLFTASGPTGTCTITATAPSGTAYTATASDTIINQAVLQVTPANPSLTEGQNQQFSSGAPATWSASCGAITSAGIFTAPLVAGSCTITATATDGSGNIASTAAAVTSPIKITPSGTNLHALNTQPFSASQAVSWTTTCGSVSSVGLFTAPALAGTCTLTGTASSGPAYTASASITVDIVNQVRWRNATEGTGLQSHELALTPANVNSTTFGQAWSSTVDGGVWAEPLYMNALTVNGAAHNVLFVGTDHATVYALDADTGAQLWSTSLLPAGASVVTGSMVDDSYIPYIGILGTPVIDNGTLYVVAESAEQNATVFPLRLHALDIATGQEKLGGPVVISDPNLPPAHRLQRAALTVANGSVYVSIGSLADKIPYNGFVFAFDNTTLAQQSVWNSTPTGTGGGIWMSGGAPSVDSSGNIYVLTGNGTSDGVTNFGQSAVKLSPSLQRLSFFTPYNAATLTASDLDLGAASVPVMPDVNGQFPHELIFCGKSPVIYVINRDSMGGFNSGTDTVIQELSNAVGGAATTRASGLACFTSPSAWGANIYFIANGDVLKQFTLNPSTGQLSTTPAHQGSFGYGWPGSQSVISSNGGSNGIIWSFDNVGKKLRADNASDVSANLFVSPAINTGYVKWITPTVINGHVYVGGQGTVVAFTSK